MENCGNFSIIIIIIYNNIKFVNFLNYKFNLGCESDKMGIKNYNYNYIM